MLTELKDKYKLCLLNVVAYHFKVYYAIAESIKDPKDVIFLSSLQGSTKSWALGLRK